MWHVRAAMLVVVALLGCSGDDGPVGPSFDEASVREAVEELYPNSPDPEQLVNLARHDCEDTDEQFRFTVNLMVAVGSDLSLLEAGCGGRLRQVIAEIEAGG